MKDTARDRDAAINLFTNEVVGAVGDKSGVDTKRLQALNLSTCVCAVAIGTSLVDIIVVSLDTPGLHRLGQHGAARTETGAGPVV